MTCRVQVTVGRLETRTRRRRRITSGERRRRRQRVLAQPLCVDYTSHTECFVRSLPLSFTVRGFNELPRQDGRLPDLRRVPERNGNHLKNVACALEAPANSSAATEPGRKVTPDWTPIYSPVLIGDEAILMTQLCAIFSHSSIHEI